MSQLTDLEKICSLDFEGIVDQIYLYCDKSKVGKVSTQHLCDFIITYLQEDSDKIESLNKYFAPFYNLEIDKATFEKTMTGWLSHINDKHHYETNGDNDFDFEKLNKLQLITKINQLELNNCTLKKQINEIKLENIDEFDQLKTELEVLESHKLTLDRHLDEMKSKYIQKKTMCENLEKRNEELFRKIESLQHKIDSVNCKLSSSESSCATLEKENKFLGDELKKLIEEKNHTKAVLSQTTKELESTAEICKNLELILKQRELEVDELKNENVYYIEYKQNLEKENEELKRKVDDVVSSRKSLFEAIKNNLNLSKKNNSEKNAENGQASNVSGEIANISQMLESSSISSSFSDNKTTWNTLIEFLSQTNNNEQSPINLEAEMKYMNLYDIHKKCEKVIEELKDKNHLLISEFAEIQEKCLNLEEAFERKKIEFEKKLFASESNKNLLKEEQCKIRNEIIELSVNYNREMNQLRSTLRYLKSQLQRKDDKLEQLMCTNDELSKQCDRLRKNCETQQYQNCSLMLFPIEKSIAITGIDTVDDLRSRASQDVRFVFTFLFPLAIFVYFAYIFYNNQQNSTSNRFFIKWFRYLLSLIRQKDTYFFF